MSNHRNEFAIVERSGRYGSLEIDKLGNLTIWSRCTCEIEKETALKMVRWLMEQYKDDLAAVPSGDIVLPQMLETHQKQINDALVEFTRGLMAGDLSNWMKKGTDDAQS